MKSTLFALALNELLDGWWSFPLGYGVQFLQQIVTRKHCACGPYLGGLALGELGQDRIAITGTRLEPPPSSKDDIALSELKVETACAHQRLGTARLDTQASDRRTLPTSLHVEGRYHALNPVTLDYFRRYFE